MRNGMRRHRAFSMIELLFVVAIMGVLLAIGLPKLGGSSERAALETTGGNIARLAAYARQMAISRGGQATLNFDKETKEWWLALPWDDIEDREVERLLRKARRGEHVALSEEEEKNVLHPRVAFSEFLVDGESVDEDQISVTFYPNGSSSGLAIVLENSKGKQLTIEIEASTGRSLAYAGEPKDFAQKLEEAGIDPTKYGLTPSDSTGMKREGGSEFYRIGSEEERVSFYSDAAERIMERARNQSKYSGTGSGKGGRIADTKGEE